MWLISEASQKKKSTHFIQIAAANILLPQQQENMTKEVLVSEIRSLGDSMNSLFQFGI